MDTEARFLTISEVARLTDYCITHLRDLGDAGVVTPHRTGSGVRLFTMEMVEKLRARRDQIRNGRVATASQSRLGAGDGKRDRG